MSADIEKLIKISIINKYAAAEGAPVIVCGNDDYTAQFFFDAEWDAYDIKTARFVYVQNGAIKYTDVVLTGDTAPVPVMADTKEVMVGVFAGDIRTSTPAHIHCEPSIRCGTGAPADPTPDVYDQIMELLRTSGPSTSTATARISYVTILADAWIGTASPYSQVVTVEGATSRSQVDLTPSVEQLSIFYNKDLAFVTENDNGVVTVYAIGQKPENDYTIQVTLTEVTR
jgi:hypothetical protein